MKYKVIRTKNGHIAIAKSDEPGTPYFGPWPNSVGHREIALDLCAAMNHGALIRKKQGLETELQKNADELRTI